MYVDVCLLQEVIMSIELCQVSLGDRVCNLRALLHHVSEVSSHMKMSTRGRVLGVGQLL